MPGLQLLAAQLTQIKGRFLLSINDVPGIRTAFAGFAMLEVETTYTISSAAAGAGKKAGELIISNMPQSVLAGGANDCR